MKKIFALIILALLSTPALAEGKKILFIGNSFTYGAGASAQFFHPEYVTDLNKENIGGVPAIFKAFAKQAGLEFDIYLETVPGAGLDLHYNKKLPLIDKKWDIVIMHSYSTLDAKAPGNPQKLIDYSKLLTQKFKTKNKNAQIFLSATWSRADQTYKENGAWFGKNIEQMGEDVHDGYIKAFDANNGAIEGVLPVGRAFNYAWQMGIADSNPYDGIDFGKIDLWSWDQYHASNYGYYLHALVVFAGITGFDVTKFGKTERAARELGISPTQAIKLQEIAQHAILIENEP